MFPEITHDDIFRLETERLWLRWPRASDAPAFVALASDPDVALKTARIPHPFEPRHAQDFIIAARETNAVGAGLILTLAPKRQPNDAIGLISAEGAATRGATELGFWLGKPFWGQGLMTEAASAFVDLIFNISSVDKIVSSAAPDNAASLRVQEKLGFVRTGTAEIPAPGRDGKIGVVTTLLKRGAAHTAFGARRPKLTSS